MCIQVFDSPEATALLERAGIRHVNMKTSPYPSTPPHRAPAASNRLIRLGLR